MGEEVGIGAKEEKKLLLVVKEEGGGDKEKMAVLPQGEREDKEKMLLLAPPPPPPVGQEDEGERVYPSPLISHDEILNNPMLFMDTLRRFHSAMCTRFMVPVIGGKELDLHRLYVEVTQRGGLEKVIGGRKWREVITAFNFPPTTTSASFVLRKYYISLLHHFEQVYFFRLQGPLVPPAAMLQTKSPSTKLDPQQQQQLVTHQNRKRSLADMQTAAAAAAPLSFTVTGTIDGKFEHGYLVTVKLGSEKLHGVLYHAATSSSTPSNSAATVVPYISTEQKDGRRRKGWRSRDPSHPKPNRSAYNFFFANEHSKLKTIHPHREREFSKMIGESWNKLTPEERMVYHDIGMKDKERYKLEMQEYKQSLKLSPPFT